MRKYGPPELWTEKLNAHRAAMSGTNRTEPRCVALRGNVGSNVSCEIYDSRPSPCQEFQVGGELCLRSRQKHGVDSPVAEFCP